MDIYTSSADVIFFDAPYNAKRLLDDSVERTGRGWSSIREGRILSGVSDILLARIESVAAFCFAALSSAVIGFGMAVAAVLTLNFALVPIAVLYIGSYIPGISSFSLVKSFRETSGDIFYRSFKVYTLAIPIVVLFLGTASINTFLPGLFQPQGFAFRSIHAAAAPLGPIQRIRAVVPGTVAIVGSETDLSILAAVEDFFRALSSFNYLREVETPSLTHHYSYTEMR